MQRTKLMPESVRNFCTQCDSLVFGGDVGKDQSFTICAGSLDDPSLFCPEIAIFTRDPPAWAIMPPGIRIFEPAPC